MKILTNFRKTVETSMDPRLVGTLLQRTRPLLMMPDPDSCKATLLTVAPSFMAAGRTTTIHTVCMSLANYTGPQIAQCNRGGQCKTKCSRIYEEIKSNCFIKERKN